MQVNLPPHRPFSPHALFLRINFCKSLHVWGLYTTQYHMTTKQQSEAGQAAAAQLHGLLSSRISVQCRRGWRGFTEGAGKGTVGGGGGGGVQQRDRGILGVLVECWSSCQRWQGLASGGVQSLAGRCCLYLLLPPPEEDTHLMPRSPIRTAVEHKLTLNSDAIIAASKSFDFPAHSTGK